MNEKIGSSEPFVFSVNELMGLAEKYKAAYDEGLPFPSVIIDDFLPKNIAEKLLLEFPSPCHDCWLERDVVNQPKKLGIKC